MAFELKWNRFVKTKGTIDGNVELDRHLEYLKKYVKPDLAQFQGKITEKSIVRCSRSYFKMEKITDYFDKQLGVVSSSGRHSIASWEEDVKQLVNNILKPTFLIINMVGFIPDSQIFLKIICLCWTFIV